MNWTKRFALAMALTLMLVGAGIPGQAQDLGGADTATELSEAAGSEMGETVTQEEVAQASTDTPTPEATDLYVSPYALVLEGTVLYRDMGCAERLGKLTADAVMLAQAVGDGLYEAYFDTERTVQGELCERAYFVSGALDRANRQQTEAYLATDSAHRLGGRPVLMASVRYEQNEETIQPDTDCANGRDEPTHEEATPSEANERRIDVAAAWDTEELRLGSRITLTATLIGYEGLRAICRWQCAAADADGNIIGEWQDAQREGLSIEYVLTQENLLTAWRLCVLTEAAHAVCDGTGRQEGESEP